MATKLTKLTIENAKPGIARRELPDTLVVGLYAVIQPSGAKGWCIRYRHGGKPRKMVIGRYATVEKGAEEPPAVLGGALTLAGARHVAREQLAAVAAGRDPGAALVETKRAGRDQDALKRGLFETVARQFIERYARPKNKSWRETARLLGFEENDDGEIVLRKIEGKGSAAKVASGAAHAWAGKQLDAITRRHVVELLDSIVDRGAPIVANRTLAAVRKCFAWTVERGLLAVSPAAGVKPPGPIRARDRVLSDDELVAVWQASDRLGHPFGPLIRLLILTGARREEVAGMAWSEVSLDGDKPAWVIPAARMKKGRSQEVPLSGAAAGILEGLSKRRIGESDFVFTTNGKTPPSGFSRAKRRLDAEVEKIIGKSIEPWVLHDLRRSLASGMAKLGISLPVIEKVLAHESGSFAGIVGVYQRHDYADEKRLALDRWAQHVEGLANGEPADNVVTLRGRA